MEVLDAVRTVLAVRQFQDKPVPEPLVHQIVEAGHLTASSNNGQPWHFIVVEDKEMLRQLGAQPILTDLMHFYRERATAAGA